MLCLFDIRFDWFLPFILTFTFVELVLLLLFCFLLHVERFFSSKREQKKKRAVNFIFLFFKIQRQKCKIQWQLENQYWKLEISIYYSHQTFFYNKTNNTIWKSFFNEKWEKQFWKQKKKRFLKISKKNQSFFNFHSIWKKEFQFKYWKWIETKRFELIQIVKLNFFIERGMNEKKKHCCAPFFKKNEKFKNSKLNSLTIIKWMIETLNSIQPKSI